MRYIVKTKLEFSEGHILYALLFDFCTSLFQYEEIDMRNWEILSEYEMRGKV